MLKICVEEFGEFDNFLIDVWFIFCEGGGFWVFIIWICVIIGVGRVSEEVGIV